MPELLNVSPVPALKNSLDSRARHMKSSGEIGMASFACAICGADLAHSCFGQFVVSAGFSASRPALGASIGNVVCICSEEQVVRVDAPRSVASMQHAQSFWYMAVDQSPRYAVSEPCLSATNAYGSVASVVDGAAPQPAAFSASIFRLRPEPLGKLNAPRDIFGRTLLHDLAPIRVVKCPRSVTTPGGGASILQEAA